MGGGWRAAAKRLPQLDGGLWVSQPPSVGRSLFTLGSQLPRTADTSRLFLFYCESRKSLSPGGDIKYVASPDLGDSWAPPVTIYTHEAEDEVPKVCGARLLAAADGSWYLPVHREPAESWHTFAGTSFHPLSEAPEKQLQLATPPGAATQVRCEQSALQRHVCETLQGLSSWVSSLQ